MNKILAILYALYVVLYVTGCAIRQSTDYELHLFMNRGADITRTKKELRNSQSTEGNHKKND